MAFKLSALWLLPLASVVACHHAVTDAPNPSGGSCDLSKAFETPVLVAGVNSTAGERHHPSLSPDELTIYFEIADDTRAGQIYSATRKTRDAAFSEPVRVPGLQVPEAPVEEGEEPTISMDGLTLQFIYRPHPPDRGCVYYAATRAHVGDGFGLPAEISGLSCVGGFFSADDQSLYFDARTTDSSGAPHLTMSRFRSTGSVWLNDGPVLSAAEDQTCGPFGCSPIVSTDGLTLLYLRASADAPDGRIWAATRAMASGPFQPVSEVGDWPELSARPLASPEWLSSDGCRLYVTAYSAAAYRGIYVAERGR